MRKFRAAVIQIDSQDDKRANLEKLSAFVTEAAGNGAKLIAMPEDANYVGADCRSAAEEIPGGGTFVLLSSLASENRVWIHGGSIPEKNGTDRPYNCTMLVAPDGSLAARYRKLHLFDIKTGNGLPEVRESSRICPGNDIVTFDTAGFSGRVMPEEALSEEKPQEEKIPGEDVSVGHLGLSICYDIRFPELYRLMALRGAEIILTPADFTMNTGKDHWEPLLRARAIENGCYIMAPGQTGRKPKYQAYGNSMIIDPWGTVIARAGNEEGVIYADIDLDFLDRVRKQILTLENRRTDIYELKTKFSEI